MLVSIEASPCMCSRRVWRHLQKSMMCVSCVSMWEQGGVVTDQCEHGIYETERKEGLNIKMIFFSVW
jgi:hypothetical protein